MVLVCVAIAVKIAVHTIREIKKAASDHDTGDEDK